MTLQVNDLHKHYPTLTEPLVVLRGVSLALSPGDAVAIVGPSGSGKSTLLNILGTLDRPTAGSVRLGDVDPFALSSNELSRFRSERIGFVFQDHHLLPQCSALENVLLARLALGSVQQEHVDRASELLRHVGLESRLAHLPAELSGGERQRVAVARALMNRPTLLLCDEPTGSLDANTGRAVADLIFSLASETRVILIAVTHSAELANRCRKVMRMELGRLDYSPCGSAERRA
jgi:lipoprotein-releasing system ATP-binding protein